MRNRLLSDRAHTLLLILVILLLSGAAGSMLLPYAKAYKEGVFLAEMKGKDFILCYLPLLFFLAITLIIAFTRNRIIGLLPLLFIGLSFFLLYLNQRALTFTLEFSTSDIDDVQASVSKNGVGFYLVSTIASGLGVLSIVNCIRLFLIPKKVRENEEVIDRF